MSNSENKPLSVAEVCELRVEDWINSGFTAVVADIKKSKSKKGADFWPCTLRDTTGSATVEMTVFQAPAFSVGDQIDVLGQGIKRGEYNGKAQVSIGKKTEIHIIGRSVHAEEQAHRATAGEPALNGALQPVNGQSVGMAMKEALAMVGNLATKDDLKSPEFWAQIHTVSSDIIRVARLLEAGKLAPSVRERNSPKVETVDPWPDPKPRTATPPTDRQMANLSDEFDDTDVPY